MSTNFFFKQNNRPQANGSPKETFSSFYFSPNVRTNVQQRAHFPALGPLGIQMTWPHLIKINWNDFYLPYGRTSTLYRWSNLSSQIRPFHHSPLISKIWRAQSVLLGRRWQIRRLVIERWSHWYASDPLELVWFYRELGDGFVYKGF
jgi:hypothetical protein